MLSSAVELPDELPPFDLRTALARINGKSKLLRRMLVSFYKEHSLTASSLHTYLSEGRQEEAERLAHSLGSNAATLGAGQLSAAARALEKALRAGELELLLDLLAPLEAALTPALAAAASVAADRPATDEHSAALSPTIDGCPTILVVDDEPINLEFMRELFADGYRVLTCGNGLDAITVATASRPDLILLDIIMPGMDGYEVCRILKNNLETREIPVVFFTGLSAEGDEIRGLELGAVDFVHKPIQSALVKARISNLIKLRQTQRHIEKLAEEKIALLTQRFAEKEELSTKVAKALADKEVLLREVHHRVKNNLQVICSMLGMQAAALEDATAVAALQNSQSRVRSMAIIHEMLYGSTAISELDFSACAQQLLRELAVTFGADVSRVRLRAAAPQFLDIDHAIPCGLILNELITNALKYAFTAREDGEVEVTFQPGEPGSMQLTIEDNGTGLPEGFQIEKTRSLGLRIVQILVKQMGGHLRVSSREGARFEVTFPVAIKT